MQCVIDYAKEKGLRRVYGDVLAENTMMLQMCAELGFHTEDLAIDDGNGHPPGVCLTLSRVS